MEESIYRSYRKVYYIFMGFFGVLVFLFLLYQIHPITIVLQKGPCTCFAKFHLYCPGCMGTHALREFMNMHFIKSFAYNPFVVLTAYLLTRYLLEGGYTFLVRRDGKMHMKLSFKDLYFCLGYFGAFAVVRDILLVLGIYDYGGYLIEYWR